MVLGVALVGAAENQRGLVAAAVFASAVAGMFGASALYHRVRWTERVRPWIRRVDHAAIYLVIGGTYTAFALIALTGAWRAAILAIVWAGVASGILLRFIWVSAPSWVAAGMGMGLGWLSLVVAPQLLGEIGPGGFGLLLAGGVAYTIGALVYALKWPDPFPAVFGYHEVFHGLVIAAVACQYASVAFYLLPNA